MRTIRASEIGTYIYCQRAWWFTKRGVEPENAAELLTGSEIHARHGRAVIGAGCLQAAAYALLLAAVVFIVVAISLRFL